MKKPIQFVILSIISFSIKSQVIINGSDINPTVGTTLSEHTCNYVNPGNSGANQTWDFSTLTSTGSQSGSASSSSSNGANIVINYSSGANIHYKNDANSQEIKYITSNSSSTIFTYSDGEKMLHFPLAYNSSYTDNFRATFITSGVYPSVRSGYNNLIVDGYGTLIMPSQTITNVIRTKLTQVYADTISISGSPYIINYSSEIYYWYKAGYKAPVLSMTSVTALNQTTQHGSYTTATNVGINEIEGLKSINLLGNPFINNLSFSVKSTKSFSIKYELVSITGDIIYASNEANLSKGINMLNISTEGLKKGIYALKISKGNSILTKMVIKN